VAEFLQVLGAERAIDDATVAAHHERHAIANDDLITIMRHPHFCDFSDGQNDTERGDTFSFNEIKSWLGDAVFKEVRKLEAPGPSPLVLAMKA
jgi:hypothetical protein